MKVAEDLNWDIVNLIVDPKYQYRHLENPPLDAIRMAWPFKTEEELKILSRWFKEEEKKLKKKQILEHKNKYGDALL